MFMINAMPDPVKPELLARLQQVETATIGHFLHAEFMDPEIRPVIDNCRVVGTAVTVLAAGADGAIVHYALGQVRPGDFLVIARAGDRRHACWGGGTALAGKVAGLAGAAIDGMATDFAEIRTLPLPTWCRGPSPITTKPLALSGGFNIPVACGGVAVNPGDAILADDSGIVVLPPSQISWVVEEALRRERLQPERMARIKAGVKLPEITGAAEKIAAALAARGKR
ncbi:MAG: RraA family protein [Proteobacteria bacterium]|nr:RraA family protein [Pseudomonadota bacterium]